MTNVQNATGLWSWNPGIMASALAILNKDLEKSAIRHKGYKTATNGEGTLFAFSAPFNALSFCLKVQQALLRAPWPPELLGRLDALEESIKDKVTEEDRILFRGLRVGMGIHCGSPLSSNDTLQTIFHGPVVDKAINIGAITRGGQILLTQQVVDMMSPTVTMQISVVIGGSENENMFARLEPHTCEILNWKHEELGVLYQLTPTCLKERVYGGFTNSELFYTKVQPVTTKSGNSEANLLRIPTPREKWIVNQARIFDKIRGGINQIGDVYVASYRDEFSGANSRVMIQNMVSLKVSDSQVLGMRVEAAYLVDLRNPNICSFFGICLSPLSLVWEYCSMGDLTKILSSPEISLPFSRRVGFLKDITKGVVFLLNSKIDGKSISFELRPSNLRIDGKWTVKIAEYGFESMKVANQTVTQNQAIAWSAPEIFAGEPENEKTLVYSFGVIMWQILTRQLPWEGTHAMKIMDAVENGERLPLAEHSNIDGMSSTSYEIYKRMLLSTWGDPSSRPTFGELAKQLDFFVVV
eukprot:Phypoly_transcript_02274.p1 GENE.Phypoly_transcript_02274~~Phypoly_transcript_02274.p1  ORF type:complete len:525 (+),score=72.51 Phypoly_transcript_02274:1266-2840(+)